MLCPRRQETGMPPPDRVEDHWREDGTCSYCGSLHPDLVLEKMANREEVTPTDKSYKMYLSNQKVYFQHFRPNHVKEFIELVNGGFANIAFPGHFYVLPFFVRRTGEGT